jgi:hypothetical protein
MGLRIISDTGMLLFPIREFFIKREELHFIGWPLIVCEVCMGSIWGSVFYLAYCSRIELLEWPVFCLQVSFINGFVWNLYMLVRNKL